MFFSCGAENFENIPTSSSSFETNSWVNNIIWVASGSKTDNCFECYYKDLGALIEAYIAKYKS